MAQLDVIVGDDLPPCITLSFSWLSCFFPSWHPCLSSFCYFISALVSPLLSFHSKPSFFFLFPSAFSFLLSSILYLILSLTLSFYFLLCHILRLWSFLFNALPTLLFHFSPTYKPLPRCILDPLKAPRGCYKHYFIIPA